MTSFEPLDPVRSETGPILTYKLKNRVAVQVKTVAVANSGGIILK